MQSTLKQRLGVLVLGGGFEGGFILLAWLLGWLLGQSPLQQFDLTPHAAVTGIAACVPMVVAAWALMRWPIGPLARIKQFSEEVIRPLFQPCGVIDLAVISLLAGVGEEMFFRGVLQPVFGRWWGVVPGLLASNLLFGLLHPISAAYVVLAALVGVYLGLVHEATGNLLVVMTAHGLYDFVVLLHLMRGSRAEAT